MSDSSEGERIAAALKAFFERYPGLIDRGTLGHDPLFLRNRIERAFHAGWDAAKVDAERTR